MPVVRGQDKNGFYYRFGSQKKYYYISNNPKSREMAKRKAIKQGIAIYSSGWKGK